MVFVGGCITHPPGGGTVTEVNGTRYWKLSTFEGGGDLSADSYYFWRSTTKPDGTTYEESGYYLVYITHPPGGASDIHYGWNFPPTAGMLTRRLGRTGSHGGYGWYAQITHPPGGGYVVCGANAWITHPPGGNFADTSK